MPKIRMKRFTKSTERLKAMIRPPPLHACLKSRRYILEYRDTFHSAKERHELKRRCKICEDEEKYSKDVLRENQKLLEND